MKLKEHIEKFDESLDKSIEKPSKSQLKEYIEKFDESLGEPLEESPIQHFHMPTTTNEKLSLFAPIEQLEREIQDKDKIIENLKNESTELKNQVSIVEKEKSAISEELEKSRWLESRVALATKKVYEDKVKSVINESVDSKIIPILTTVARRKQGNQQLNFGNWLKIPENRYLFEINKNIAKGIFEDTNALISRRFDEENTRGSGDPTTAYANNYSLTFAGPANNNTDGPFVSTAFDPQAYSLNNGFTVSYWVKPDELGTHMFALGRRHGSLTNQRFTFGLNTSTRGYFGVGNTKKTGYDHGMSTGTWYHWIITFAGGTNGELKAYRDSTEIMDTTTTWTVTTDDTPIYFGCRNVKDIGFNNGWDCSLDEVAIFDEVKDSDWVTSTYNGGTPADLQNESGLVGYWRFEEGSGTTAADLSGNGNHGTLTTEDADLPTWSTDTP